MNCKNEEFWNDEKTLFIKEFVFELYESYQDEEAINHNEGANLPSKNEIAQLINYFEEIIFPGFFEKQILDIKSIHYFIGSLIFKLFSELHNRIVRVFCYECKKMHKKDCNSCDINKKVDEIVRHVIKAIYKIRKLIKLDIKAAYDGDPAAKSYEEIVLSYPGIYAIMIHRIAHELYVKEVPLIPRMMSEYAHSKVGIDIHPGASIGESFFIDHGTGVVIGETCVIGNNVKIYQGVTLGALSFPKTPDGRVVKGLKRHPTIEDNVTIYSGATVLGNIVIGNGTVIGGNVWLTESVGPNSLVSIPKPELSIKTKK